MLLKKSALLGVTLALFTLPLIAAANDLHTYNHTGRWSTVKVFDRKCSGAMGKYTGPGREKIKVPGGEVNLICDKKNPCSATVIISDSEDKIKRCDGVQVARVTINSDPDAIEITEIEMLNGGYTLKGKNSDTLDIS